MATNSQILAKIKFSRTFPNLQYCIMTEPFPPTGHGICNNLSKSVSLPLATDDAKIVGKEVVTILRQQRAAPEDLRGVSSLKLWINIEFIVKPVFVVIRLLEINDVIS